MLIAAIVSSIIANAAPMLVHPGEDAAYAAQLRDQAVAADAHFSGSRCDAAKIESTQREDVKITASPNVAAAREVVRVSGCGHSHRENILVARLYGPTPWTMVAGLPGEPLGEMPLQNAAFAAVIAQLAPLGPSGCTRATLDDIYVAARPGRVGFTNVGSPPLNSPKFSVSLPEELRSQQSGLDLPAAWVEIWPLSFCNTGRMVAVVFVPNQQHKQSTYFITPIWPQIEAHGANAKPAGD